MANARKINKFSIFQYRYYCRSWMPHARAFFWHMASHSKQKIDKFQLFHRLIGTFEPTCLPSKATSATTSWNPSVFFGKFWKLRWTAKTKVLQWTLIAGSIRLQISKVCWKTPFQASETRDFGFWPWKFCLWSAKTNFFDQISLVLRVWSYSTLKKDIKKCMTLYNNLKIWCLEKLSKIFHIKFIWIPYRRGR